MTVYHTLHWACPSLCMGKATVVFDTSGSQHSTALASHSLPLCSLQEIKDWHRPRMECIVEEGVDFICIETIAARVCAYTDMLSLDCHIIVTELSVITQLPLCLSLSCH